MYERSAEFYDAIYNWKDYPREIERLQELIAIHRDPTGSLLDVACGTGKHLSLLQAHYAVTGLEKDSRMAQIARQRLPEADIQLGDMRNFHLGTSFDVVTCLFSSIGYMQTPEDLAFAIRQMKLHLAPNGLLIVEPWLHPHQFIEGHVGGDFYDGEEMKVARVARSWTEGPISVLELHHLVGTSEGVSSFTETHHMGLFTDAEYRAALVSEGLAVHHDEQGLMGRGLYIAQVRGS